MYIGFLVNNRTCTVYLHPYQLGKWACLGTLVLISGQRGHVAILVADAEEDGTSLITKADYTYIVQSVYSN